MRRVHVAYIGRKGRRQALALGALLGLAALTVWWLKAGGAVAPPDLPAIVAQSVTTATTSKTAATASSSPTVPNDPIGSVDASVVVPPPPALQAASAVLLDLESGRILFTQKAYERRPPGVLTKIVTALVVLLRGGLDESVRIGREAAAAPGYGLRLEEGEEFPLRDLITYMYFHPGNDGAIAIAEHVAGSVQAFAGQMESVARQSGAGQSTFRTPHGLDESGHLSSAFDLAMISRAALGVPDFARMAGLRRTLLPWRGRERDLRNLNSFLWRYPGALGVKSSYTPESGHSMVAAARRGEQSLLAVVLGAPSAEARWLDVASLLEYGFANLSVLSEAPLVEKVPYEVQAGDTLTSLARRFEVPIDAIRLLNGLEDPDRLAVGSHLWIPR